MSHAWHTFLATLESEGGLRCTWKSVPPSFSHASGAVSFSTNTIDPGHASCAHDDDQ